MPEMHPRDQMPPAVVEMIAVVGELIAVKKKFDAGELSLDKLADALWEKVQELEGNHAAVQGAVQ